MFETTLSKELLLVASTFSLCERAITQLNRRAIDFAFLSEAEKQVLRQKIDETAVKLLARL
jgi:adenosine deaminase